MKWLVHRHLEKRVLYDGGWAYFFQASASARRVADSRSADFPEESGERGENWRMML